VDSRIALFSNAFTFHNVKTFILAKLLSTHMGYPRLGVPFHTETNQEHTQSKSNNVSPGWYVVAHGRQIDSGGLKCWFQVLSDLVK
jgi:hypothetical protein